MRAHRPCPFAVDAFLCTAWNCSLPCDSSSSSSASLRRCQPSHVRRETNQVPRKSNQIKLNSMRACPEDAKRSCNQLWVIRERKSLCACPRFTDLRFIGPCFDCGAHKGTRELQPEPWVLGGAHHLKGCAFWIKRESTVDQLKRTRSGNPNTESPLLTSHFLVPGSGGRSSVIFRGCTAPWLHSWGFSSLCNHLLGIQTRVDKC